MKLTERSVADLLAAFRSPAPTPGGGSASALGGAIGASLLAMVASMPSRRAAAEEDVDRLQSAARRCTALADRLAALIDEDSGAYELVVAAYKLPKTSDPEKAERSRRIQQAMTAAIDVPLDVMRRAADAIETGAVVAALGNPNAASDVGVALELLAAAVRGAMLNVEINLESIKDQDYLEKVRREANTLEEQCASGTAAARALLSDPG